MTRIVYISGHLDVTEAEFAEHYEPRIRAAFEAGASFVVGDARGADAMAQAFLKKLLGSPATTSGTAPRAGSPRMKSETLQ